MSRRLASRPGTRARLADVALVAAVFVAYLPALDAGFVWDDDHYVVANATLRSLDGLRRIWLEPGATPQYYPLTFSSLWIDFHLWGLAPRGYHLVNVGLHALAAVLLRRVLARLEVPGAWLGAALFALHPIAVESVAWVTERKNVLSTVCCLASALAYLRFAGVPTADRWTGSATAWTGAAFLFVLALLAKTVTATLPGALAVALWWRRGRVARADVLPLVPLLTLGGIAGLGTAWVERHHVGAVGADFTLTGAERLLVAGRAVWFYLATLAWPRDLTFIYPRWRPDPSAVGQWVPLLAAGAALGLLWAMRRRIGRGPLAAALVFGGTLLPALGFVDVYPFRYSFVADHFAYLASIGPLAFAGGAATTLPMPWRGLVVVAVLASLGGLTWTRSHAYHDAETLWRDTLARNPGAWMAHNNLGVLLFERGEQDAALGHYRQAERRAPDAAEIQINLGNVLASMARTEDALAAYRRAIVLKPNSAGAWNNLGATLLGVGRIDEAVAAYREAIALRPDYADAHANLGAALLARGDPGGSVAALERSLALRPDEPQTLSNLGAALLHAGQPAEARVRFERALRLRPAYPEARSNLGNALLALGRLDAAVDAYRQALVLRPDYAEGQYNLGHALVLQGRKEEARGHFAAAVRLDPTLEPAQRELAELGPASPPGSGR